MTRGSRQRRYLEMRGQVQTMIAAQLREMRVPEKMRDESVRSKQPLTDLVLDGLSSSKMKSSYVDICASTFTADELAGLTAFFKSPPGRASVERMPVVTKRMLEVSQSGTQALQLRIRKPCCLGVSNQRSRHSHLRGTPCPSSA